MQYWSELDSNNVVIRCLVLDDKPSEENKNWLIESLGGTWIQTFDDQNVLTNPTKNMGTPGAQYDASTGAFMREKPFPSWVLNDVTFAWEPPVAMPTDGKLYMWDENLQSWVEDKSVK